MDQPTKSFNTKGGKNRLRFASSKSRAKHASADVYRNGTSDRLSSTSSTAVREKRVHDSSFRDSDGNGGASKRRRRKGGKAKDDGDVHVVIKEDEDEEEVRYFGRDNDAEGLGMGRTAVIVSSKSKLQLETPEAAGADEDTKDVSEEQELENEAKEEEDEEEEEQTALVTGGTIFLSELDVSAQRNGSLLFQKLVRELRPLCKSLAELLHHSEGIVELLIAHLLSPRGGMDHTPSRFAKESWKSYMKRLSDEVAPDGYTINVATNDVLHLFGVLARELRQEIYPYLTTRILPRIIDDMLNPPPTTTMIDSDNHQQNQRNNVPLDVSHIESAFRTLSYLFKYNAEQLIYNHLPKQQLDGGVVTKGKKSQGDADILRRYYGKTICHRRDIVRRLACESYAPLLRKCVDSGLKRHLGRTVKALASSLAAAAAVATEEGAGDEVVGDETTGTNGMTNSAKRARSDAIDGVSSLFFEVVRGAPGRVHSKKGRLVVRTLLDSLVGCGGGSKKKNNANKKSEEMSDGDPRKLVLERNKAEALYEVASQFLYKLRGHIVRGSGAHEGGGDEVTGGAFAEVLDEMHRALDAATTTMKELPPSSTSSSTEITTSTVSIVHSIAGYVIGLMTETIDFQDGRLLVNKDRVTNSLQTLLNRDIYSHATRELQDRILQYLCAAWRTNPNHPSFALRLGKFFPSIVAPPTDSSDATTSSLEDGGLDPALFLGRNLLPHLPKKVASTYLIPALLNAAAASSCGDKSNTDSSLVLLHTIATAVWPTVDPHRSHDVDIDDTVADALFAREAAENCPEISPNLRSSLFDICLSNIDFESNPPTPKKGQKKRSKKKSLPPPSQSSLADLQKLLARVGYISRCIPFLVCLECSGGGDDDEEGSEEDEGESSVDDSHSEEMLKRVFKWYASVLKGLDARAKENDKADSYAYIVESLVLESFSKSVTECHRRVSLPNTHVPMKKALVKAKEYANSLLILHPKSIWVVRGVAAVSKALSIIDPAESKLNDRFDETFELLIPNLAEPNHFLRLYTLQILESYPARPFVTDHADLDLTDDLDEDPSYRPPTQDDIEGEVANNADSSSAVSSLSGLCDVISLLRTLESIPIALPNERRISSQLSRVEVYARTGKLPIVYAEAIAAHMIGLLHVKFAPIWPSAVQVVVTLSSAQEGPAWSYIEEALKRSMDKLPPSEDDDTNQTTALENDDGKESGHPNTIARHQKQCIDWDKSRGKNIDIFGSSQNEVERNAQVSRHVAADELTVFESIWSIMENAPHLTSTKSKSVVPIFVEFLVSQYYVFHTDDPDAREIDFAGIVESTSATWLKEELGRKSMQKKLESFLRIFAAVKGPQQLFKHKVLLQIFVSFLANPDAKLSNLAFACVLRFKLPYFSPYVEYVQPMLRREGLREALTKFDLSETSEIVDKEHRLLLLPIVTRILFGRFSSRGSGAKSSKDSPAARRAAILSFFSGIGNASGELNYFIYMMVRAFVPQDVNTKVVGVQMDKGSLMELIEASEGITSEELTNIPIKRQEGFLNLLSDVITQIGFAAKHFVATFMNLLLALCEQTEHALVTSIKNQALKMEAIDNECTSFIENDGNSRIGRIRTLSFLRLSDLMTKFASSVDFSTHGQRLWKSISSSVIALPNTVINAENPPSLLKLIESISMHHMLIPLLHESDDAIVAVFKCIAGTTRMKVMTSVLHIIDGLLTDGGTVKDTNVSGIEQSTGQSLVLKHIHMLIAQFTNRLTNDSQIANLDEDVVSRSFMNKKASSKQNPTEGLQLNILCRVTELLVSAGRANEEHVATMENLCSLLVPLLKFDSHPNQLYVVRTVNSLIPTLSTEAAMSHFHNLSKLLGPNKNNVGITSNEHRQIISTAISAICSRDLGCPKLKLVAKAVVDVNAVSTSYVDEHDFERILPVLNGLGASSNAEGSWLDLSRVNIEELQNTYNLPKTFDGTRILLPFIYTCFQLLYDSDGVISRASNKALKCLVTSSSELAQSNAQQTENAHRNPWVKLIETTVVPCLKIGIMTKEIAPRRNFVLLISHVTRHFSDYNSVHLYGDLNCLIRDDDQDLDFFLNMTHVQLHRRARALNRLRRLLSGNGDSTDQSSLFSVQSLGNILLPLAMHPVYEYKSKAEDAYVIEAIAAVGEISKHLPWSKYNSTLQSVLNNLVRYPDQERFLIAMICAIIDGFHFSVDTGEGTDDGPSSQGNGVWRTLKNRIMPKVESFLIKEKIDRHGAKNKSLRSSVALALMKLFQKFPQVTFESKLRKLITTVCNALKNKESNERDTARDTLTKMAVGLDMKYLPLILSELSISLHEGYKLHVRSATLHSILVAISKVYQQPHVDSIDEVVSLPFDRCVPAMLDLIHQDIFGKASEIKEAQQVEKRLIKEAMGKKSLDALEIIARSVHFKPSLVTVQGKKSFPGLAHASAAHALVTPFLDRLRDPDVPSSTIRKVRECLNRVAVGFSNNPSAKYEEVLPFVFATIAPFVHGKMRKPIADEDADLEDSDAEVEAPIQVSNSNKPISADSGSARMKSTKTVVAVATWTPSNLGDAKNQKSALAMKKKQKKELHRVIDGAAAPKFTGSSRHSPLKSAKAKTLNNPANACAVSFGLTLLNSSLKRSKLDVSDDKLCAMADPYLPLLAHCVRFSSSNEAVILSLRCLGVLLRVDLPSVPKAARDLGPSILDHLTASGAASNTQSDIVQGCFKTLTLLISHQKFSSPPNHNATLASFDDANPPKPTRETLPLTTSQMQALLSLLHSAVREYDHHNSTFGLVKAILLKRYMSSELYDLMDIILKLSVQSQKSTIRLASSQIFLQYLIDYPMGKQRMDNHLHQIVLNIKYEYEEGRLSAIDLFSSVIQKFPLPVLEEKSQFFFLPLVLQLANDDSKKCKEAVAECISLLLQRLSTESVQAFFGYAKRWSLSSGIDSLPMQRASAQLFGIFVDSRPDYVKRGSNASDLISIVLDVMLKQITFESESGWELLYHNLICTEKLNKQLPSLLPANYEIWGALVKMLAYPHPWIMQVSSRIISSHLSTIEPTKLLSDGPESFAVKIPGCLYKIASNLCRQLDVEDVHYVESTSTIAIKTISWVFRAMKQHPNICYDVDEGNKGGSGEEENALERSKDPCLWLMTRLSNIAKPKDIHRRESVFKCFAALCTSCNPDDLIPYLELMIDPIDRAIREANNLHPDEQTGNDPKSAIPKDVLQIVEDTCGTEQFLRAFAEVNRKVREKRDKRKQELASEAIHNPAAAAQRKIKRQIGKRERKKGKIDDRRAMRGASKKRRHS